MLFKLIFSLIIGIVSFFIYPIPITQEIENKALDLWFNIRGEIAAPDQVILIAMDEASYEELGIAMNKAWPRSVHARLLDRLAEAGAKKAIFDIAFLGASDDTTADQQLEESLKKLPTVIGIDSGPSASNPEVIEFYLPYKPFREAASEIALVSLPEDSGYIRRFNNSSSEIASAYRSLAEASLDTEIELPEPHHFIKYYGAAGSIKTYSYADILSPKFIPDSELKNRVVYIGLLLRTGLGPAQKDSFLTPFSSKGRTFGVEIHATSALNLINKDWIKRMPLEKEALWIALSSSLLTISLITLPPSFGLFLLIISALVWMGVSYSYFLSNFFLPGASILFFIAPLIYLISTFYSYIQARKRELKAERAFSLYLNPEMAKQVARDPKALELGGKTVKATALFTDIEGFTEMAEKMPAEEVADMLNDYFTVVAGEIVESGGTLVKFIGDAVFAIWGAPIAKENHEEIALKTALIIQDKINKFNNIAKYPVLRTRIGINSGAMLVGNLGSNTRFDYTAIGDEVNLTARLEGLNKYFGTEILLSESTLKMQQPHNYRFCLMGAVVVKGKDKAVNVYTVLPQTVSEEDKKVWLDTLALFRERSFAKAERSFIDIKDTIKFFSLAAELYLEQITEAKSRAKKEHWKGQLVFENK